MQRPEGQTACHDTHLMKGARLSSSVEGVRVYCGVLGPCPSFLESQGPRHPVPTEVCLKDPMSVADSSQPPAGAGFLCLPPPSGLPAVLE